MTDLTPAVTEGRVRCEATAASCRCYKDAGHVEAGDDVHSCDKRRCTGEWRGDEADGTFEIVMLPFPVGVPEPWGDEE